MCIGKPVWLSNDEFAVFEEATPLVANLAVDVEGQGTYEIVGGPDADAFKINPDTGLLAFKNGAPDFENPTDQGRDNMYNVTVQFTDFSGASVSRDIKVTVEDNPDDNGGGGGGGGGNDPGTAALGDRVWLDANGDGVFDGSSESGVAGVKVTLTGAGDDGEFGTADDTTQVKRTNRDGKYSFKKLDAGDYKVTFSDIPDGLEFTTKDVGSDERKDSDAGANGMTDVITLAKGERNFKVDAGLVPTGDPGPGNTDPNAVNDSRTTDLNTPVTIDVLGNDSDPENDPLSITSLGTPANGTAEVVNGRVVYTPDPGFTGTDTFDYHISDGNGGTDTAQVRVTVEDNTPSDPGNAQIGDQVWLDANGDGIRQGGEAPVSGVAVTLTGAGADGQFGTADDISQTKRTNSRGKYIFKNLDGGDYRISVDAPNGLSFTTQDAGSDEGKDSDVDANGVSDVIRLAPGERNRKVDVGLVEDAPANSDPTARNDRDTTPLNTPVTINVLGNDSDPENDPLSITATMNPFNGTVEVVNNQVVYTPNPGFIGNDMFTYDISDGNGGTDTAQVRVTVTPPVNTAPTAVNDRDTTELNTPVDIDVLGNDSDPENDPLNITEVSDPINGSARIVDGQIEYTPNPGFTGNDIFTYGITDGNGGTDTARVNVTVTPPANTDPTAVNDRETTDFNTPVSINVLGNDSDPENDPLRVTSIEGQTVNPGDTIDVGNGTATLLDNGQISFTPDNGFSGTETFSYHVSDGNGGEDTANVTVDVTAPPTVTLVGDSTIMEGDSGRYHVQVDQASAQDRQVTLNIMDGTANRFDNNSQIFRQIVNGASDGGFSWGNYTDGTNAFDDTTVTNLRRAYIVRRDFSGKVPLGTSASSPQVPQVGNSAQNWDFNVTQNGRLNVGDTITVTIPAGQTKSDSFDVNAALERVVIDNFLSGNNNLGVRLNDNAVEGTGVNILRNGFTRTSDLETFSIKIADAGDAQIGNGTINVGIQDKTDYTFVSPISFDLNGDGIQTLSIDNGVTFDMLNTGAAVNTGWLSGDDGFLAIDTDGDGAISSRAELFGGGVGDGFAKLSSFDSNGDGVVNAGDAQFAELKLWQDANENGVTDQGELVSLESAGITDLNTAYTNVFSTDAQGNIHGEVSSAVKNGSAIEMTDVYFQVAV